MNPPVSAALPKTARLKQQRTTRAKEGKPPVPQGDVMLGYLHPNEVAASFHKSLLSLVGWDMAHDRRLHGWSTVKCAAGGLPEGRNQLMQALINSDAQWMFMVDADMGFEPMALDMLLSMADPEERPIVGGLCFAQREAFEDGMSGFRCVPRPTIFDYIEHPDGHSRFTGRAHYPVNTLVKCAATGGAFLVIHRSVAERILEANGPVWFDRVRGTDNSLIGEDISFWVRCQALDIPCHVHTGIRTTHLKNLWVGENDFFESFYPQPATEEVDVIIPVIHRPQNVKPFMESLKATTGLARALWICDPDDIEQQEEVKKYGGDVVLCPGSYAQKANFAWNHTNRPWMLLAGDDVVFRPGWLDHALDVARRYQADVIGTNDLANPRVMRGEHATHMLVRRSYIEEQGCTWDGPGIVCHEGYHHWFNDDEIVTVAKQRGVFQAALGSQIEHMHPLAGKAPVDDVYRHNDSKAKQDQRLFEKRHAASMKKAA
jgi:hypothetical protein